ncbi:hypothetical protein CYMTET_18012 [Cymbomonas tetramitiformis]|uniref:Uncharacterized protein n=1 Tax=Cymbomonas tetramitiformis TaxID=36881 RepID=A0AAE0G9B0_9CHLO|nr:hypothetical protein CYMTET_18012 [Cymbomonas tetramitiformis]
MVRSRPPQQPPRVDVITLTVSCGIFIKRADLLRLYTERRDYTEVSAKYATARGESAGRREPAKKRGVLYF